MKKGISFILIMVLLLTMFNVPVFAASGGSGTSGDPYQIKTWEDLYNIRTSPSKYYVLMNNLTTGSIGYASYAAITTDNPNGWEPIGNSTTAFSGNFNGGGYTISDLKISRSGIDWVGLFGYANGATINNIKLVDVNIIGNSNVGGLAGQCRWTKITNASVTGTVSGTGQVGGLVGRNETLQAPYYMISNSYATCSVSGTGPEIGGLVGNNAGTVISSYAIGTVSGNNDSTGGLVGNNTGTIDSCYANGTVTSTGNYTGGLTGKNSSSINKSYATGGVTGFDQVGGLVGAVSGGYVYDSYAIGNVSGSTNVGGLVGKNGIKNVSPGVVSDSYATGTVSGTSNLGGLVGFNDSPNGEINRSFWDKDTSGILIGVGMGLSTGVTSKSTADMMKKATFTGSSWDFASPGGIWAIANKSYPYFIWMTTVDGWNINQAPGYVKGEDLYTSGTGIKSDPYLIGNKAQLNGIREDLAAYYKLASDIEFNKADFAAGDASTSDGAFYNDGKGWEPIGIDSTTKFTGGFDGNGHIITGLYINRKYDSSNTNANNNVGFFGYIASPASISAIGLVNVDITGNKEVGALVGTNDGGTISGAYASGTVKATDKETAKHIGGLVGFNKKGTGTGSITDSYSTCDVTAEGTSDIWAGGFVGENYNFGSISNSYSTGHVTGNNSGTTKNRIGGFAGENYGTITMSFASGTVIGLATGVVTSTPYNPENNANYVGGFVAINVATINNSYATGNVDGNASSGTGANKVGGFVGENFGTITNTYSIGLVTGTGNSTGTSKINGYIGNLGGGSISKSFWDKDTSQKSEGGATSGITGLTTASMKAKGTFTTSPALWSFYDSSSDPNGIWVMTSVSGKCSYPYFKWMESLLGWQSSDAPGYGTCPSSSNNNNNTNNTGGGNGGGGGGGSAPQNNGGVIINGQSLAAGNETTSIENGKSTVQLKLDNQAFGSILNAINNSQNGKGNELQLAMINTGAQVAKVDLSGDLVKNLEKNTVLISIKHNDVEYVIPAAEFNIGKVAETLGVPESQLLNIQVEVKISKVDAAAVDLYKKVAAKNNDEILVTPVTFEIKARASNADGTAAEVSIGKFNNYVKRITEIPAGVDPTKITTGIVFNSDGTYSHVPTEVFLKDGKYYAKLNSLTNSNYSVIWNPITVASVVNHWSEKAVNDMASRMVVFNTESFAPDQAITRADFAEYIVRALGLYQQSLGQGIAFADVVSTGDRTKAIQIANQYGIITGYPDGTFRPDQLITREEAMAMYQRAMTVAKLTGSDSGRYQNYADFSQVEEWARGYVKEVLSAHVFNGTTTTTISPKANLTYAESAQAIRNLLTESKLINQ